MKHENKTPLSGNETLHTEVIKLHVSAQQYRAFQRCMWILVNETAKTQMDIMNEMVNDFLIKHGC
jgi:hypothetical protein